VLKRVIMERDTYNQRWGFGERAKEKKKLILEGKLDKHGKANEKTPKQWLSNDGKSGFLPALTCDTQEPKADGEASPMKKKAPKIEEVEEEGESSPKKAKKSKKEKKEESDVEEEAPKKKKKDKKAKVEEDDEEEPRKRRASSTAGSRAGSPMKKKTKRAAEE